MERIIILLNYCAQLCRLREFSQTSFYSSRLIRNGSACVLAQSFQSSSQTLEPKFQLARACVSCVFTANPKLVFLARAIRYEIRTFA